MAMLECQPIFFANQYSMLLMHAQAGLACRCMRKSRRRKLRVSESVMSHRNISGGDFRLKNANLAEIFFINTSILVHNMFNFFSEKIVNNMFYNNKSF